MSDALTWLCIISTYAAATGAAMLLELLFSVYEDVRRG